MAGWMYVFLGGGIGSVVRYGIGRYFDPIATNFPFGTMLANFLSCFILGMLLGMQGNGQLSEQRALLLMTGFCGGFSTFSAFSLESVSLFQNGNYFQAGLYVLGSISIGILAIILGIKIQSTIY